MCLSTMPFFMVILQTVKVVGTSILSTIQKFENSIDLCYWCPESCWILNLILYMKPNFSNPELIFVSVPIISILLSFSKDTEKHIMVIVRQNNNALFILMHSTQCSETEIKVRIEVYIALSMFIYCYTTVTGQQARLLVYYYLSLYFQSYF